MMDYRDVMGVGELKLEPGIQDLILRALNPREPVEAKIGQDGQFTVDMFKKEKPKGEGGEKKPGEGAKPTTPQVGFEPAIAALTGPAGGPGVKELAGLTPEQVMAVMGMEARKRQLEQGTIGQLLDLPYRQAQVKKLLTPELTYEQQLGLKKAGTTSLAEKMALKKTPTDIPRGKWFKSKETGDTAWVETGKLPPGKDYEMVPEKTIRTLSEEKFEKAKATKASDARYAILHPDTKKRAKEGLIHEANDGWRGTTLYVWDSGKGVFNLAGVEELTLPPGIVADDFTPEMTEAIGRGETIYVTHPTLGDVALKREKDSVVIVR